MVIAEARRTFTYLSLFGYQVDAVVVNRVLPEVAAGDWFDDWRRSQQEHLAAIAEGFAPLPQFHADHTGSEVVGLDALARLADRLWDGIDPSCRLVQDQPLRICRRGDDVVLSLELPFAERDEVELTRSADELFIALGPHRRNLVLPDSLRRRRLAGASLVDGRLEVVFVPPEPDGSAE
jgi:arsenite-transporting ATPase